MSDHAPEHDWRTDRIRRRLAALRRADCELTAFGTPSVGRGAEE
jgi:hypothetical protein